MSDRQRIPLKLINTTLGPREVEFKQRELARFGRGPMLPGAGDFIRACAMVDTALNLNKTVRHLWLDICCAWDKPGCVGYASWLKDGCDLARHLSDIETGSSIARAYNEWQQTYFPKFKQDPDIINIRGLIDEFILQAFNGPTNPVSRRVLGTIEYLRKPKYKVKVTADKARPELKQAIAFLSWGDHEDIDLREVDQVRMGADYEVVTSGKKPSTVYGRKRKPEITKAVRNAGLSFIGDEAIYSGAEKWYDARVILGSITEAASDYGIANPSTFETEIKDFDHIAGLR